MSVKYRDSSKLFFTSDTHFQHRGVLEYSNRPFKDIDSHDEALITNWNVVVPKDGIVFHLGDFFLCNQEKALKIFNRLNGKICLIEGNHDKTVNQASFKGNFLWKERYERIRVKDDDAKCGWQDICLFHYPLASWEKMRYGSWHLHGHCHTSYVPKSDKLVMDVGVDSIVAHWHESWKRVCSEEPYDEIIEDSLVMYSPISYEDVKTVMRRKIAEKKQTIKSIETHERDLHPYNHIFSGWDSPYDL